MRRAAPLLVTASVVLGGCSGDGSGEGAEAPAPAEPETLRARLSGPDEPTTVVGAAGGGDLAAAASATLFDEAPVVVVAPEGDLGGQALAASAAVALGMPLLLSPPAGDPEDGASASTATTGPAPDDPAADELDRLSPRSVLAFGRPAVRWAERRAGDVPVVAAPTEPAALRSLDGLDLDVDQAVPADGMVDAAATLDDGRPRLLILDDGEPPGPGADAGQAPGPGARAGSPGATDGGTQDDAELPTVEAADPLDDLLVVVERDAAGVAAAATARASGATVLTVAGTDPRADTGAITALAGEPLPERVVALGDGFGPAGRLRQRLEVAATGVELPGGGQVVFPARRMIALYGHPGAPVLGVLGEQPVDAAVTRAQDMAAGYEGLVDEAIVPAFEIITTVASASPGPDGDYSAESEVADLRPWVDAAGRAGVYVVLDLQPGRTDFLTQAQRYEELLAEPHVGLALDPEWRLGPDQRHLAQIGSVGADEVNAVADWLAGLTRDRRLPQKLLLLHQFQLRMIGDRGRVDTGHDELAVLVHADGFGTPGQKLETWSALRQEPLPGAWWGWKNFIDEDQPTFTPEQTVAVDPTPWFVSYQ
ncbi:MAG TPA: hypothetical protein VFZ79_02860 [Acidimicrobiales bacterium]